MICHEKHTAKYTNEISEHGVFPLVSVRVWHGEPGNMHPYNFEAHFAKTLVWTYYCKKPQNSQFHDYPTCISMLNSHAMNKEQYPVEKLPNISIIHTSEGHYPNTDVNKA